MTTRSESLARNIEKNTESLDQHQQVFNGLVAAGFRIVKVNAPLSEKQASGQWAVSGCSCGDPDCASIGKHPLGKGWQNRFTANWDIARQWLGEGYNLGAFTPDGARAIAVDIDRPEVIDQMFPDGRPQTMGDSIGGKEHLFFTIPDGIDIDDIPATFDGGEISVGGSRHVVAPLGMHPRGQRKWNNITDIADIPLDTLAWLQHSKRQTDQKFDNAAPGDDDWTVTDGNRHVWLVSQAGRLRNFLASEGGLLAALRDLNANRCDPPLDDEWLATLAHNYWTQKEGSAPPNFSIGTAPTSERLDSAAFSSFKPRLTLWHWAQWFPQEETVFLEGSSGLGKSTFAMDFFARLTSGRVMPDGTPNTTGKPIRVLYITTEDDIERVLVPRALAAGADLDYLTFVKGEFTLPEDETKLLNEVRHHGDVGVVFIDPLFSHVGADKTGKTLDTNSDTQMRQQVMTPLARVEKATGITAILGRHLNKNTNMDISMRGSGSYGGLAGRSRGVLFAAYDPQDPTHETMVIGPIKQQYSAKPNAKRFRLVGASITFDGIDYPTSVISWEEGNVGSDIETYLTALEPTGNARTARKNELDDLIRELLEADCVPSATFEQRLLRDNYTEYLSKEARKRVGVIAHQHNPQQWYVRLADVVCSKMREKADAQRAADASRWTGGVPEPDDDGEGSGDETKVPRARRPQKVAPCTP